MGTRVVGNGSWRELPGMGLTGVGGNLRRLAGGAGNGIDGS